MLSGTGVSLAAVVLMLAGIGLPHQQREAASPALTADEVLERTRALYPTLQSYADTGTVTEESTGFINRSSFRTYYVNAPRNFFFDYRRIGSEYETGQRIPLTNRIVLWMLHGQLQSWDSALDSHQEFPEGTNQIEAFVAVNAGTSGAAILIPSLIYVKANMVATLQELGDVESAGFETLRGRRCYKLMGIARSVYPSGQVTNVRPTTVWIDAETFLIRQVFTDTPKGYPRGSISRLTIAYEPRLNPALHDSLFTFTVPSAQQ
jgi:outer membrane lipoprotein-sorting protein